MPCYHPISAWQTVAGDVVFKERGNIARSLFLPCGRCIGCRLERSRQWAVRIMHEASLHKQNSFVTFTYDDEKCVDEVFSLDYTDYQLFMKRLRKSYGKVRFFCVGEYGDIHRRPHFHAGLFGYWPDDARAWRKSPSGHGLFRSASLERLWPHGNVEIGRLTFESAAYMARYCCAKVNGDLAKDHYSEVDPETGEVREREPEFARMSLRPGIGAAWFNKFGGRVMDHDSVISNGHEAKPPRYYDVLHERVNPENFESVRFKRAERAKESFSEGTDERLAVREVVANARLRFKKRTIE